jgi:hypothetical protein
MMIGQKNGGADCTVAKVSRGFEVAVYGRGSMACIAQANFTTRRAAVRWVRLNYGGNTRDLNTFKRVR